MKAHSKSVPIYAGLFFISILFAGANLYWGQSEFGGYDLSALIDAGWRVLNGQLPTLNFICTYPPTFYIFSDTAFRVFGVHWISLLIAEDVLFLSLVVLGLRLCWILNIRNQNGPQYLLAGVYVAAQSILLLAINHLWHSTTASGFAAYAILAAYVLTQQISPAQRKEVVCHLALAFAVLLLSKPNTAWPAILVCLLCLFKDRSFRLPAVSAFVAAIIGDACLLAFFHAGFSQMFHSYLGLSGRAVPRLFLVGIHPERTRIGAIVVFFTYLFLFLPSLQMIRIFWRECARIWASSADLLCLGAAMVSVLGFGTNWELKIADVAPLLVGMGILANTNPERYKQLMPSLQWSASLLLLLAVCLGAARIRMQTVGSWAGSHYGQKVEIHDPFFGDFVTRQSFRDLLQEVDAVTSHSPGKKIFFGPRMEFLYARDGLTSPAHLPLCWHPGTSYPFSSELDVENAWEDDHFDILIFAKNDRTRFPEKLLNAMSAEYTFDGSQREIDIFYRK